MAALTKHRHVHSSVSPPIMNLYNYKLLSEIKTDAKNCVQSPDRPGFSLGVV
jgi:hypothetical protein